MFKNSQDIQLPGLSRPAFVSWQAGGAQEFPNDPVADAQRERALRAAGLIKTRRIPANKVAA